MAVMLIVLEIGVGPLVPSAGAATRLDVSAGYAGFHVPGRALPVAVTVNAERLVSGELAVVVAGRKEPVTTLPVEVAGGSVKRFLLVVPGGIVDDSGTIDVQLRQGGQTLGQGRAEVRSADDAELVGLGAGLLADGRSAPGPASLAVDAGVARFAALEPSFLNQAPTALEGLSAVGLAAGELAALAPSARAGLLRWVAGGGHLLLDEPAGATVDGLPVEWRPAAAGRTVAGRGEVRLVGGALAAGRWNGLVEPTDHGRFHPKMFSSDSVANSLAGDAGLRLPRLGWLLGFVGLYILAVGPLTAVVLRRRRRPELAWVVVPALAVMFTGFAFGTGNHLRPASGLAHATLLETDGPSPVATSWVGVSRRTAGTTTVELPGAWAVEPTQAVDGSGLRLPTTAPGRDGPSARLPLAGGEFGVLKASGPVSLPGRLEVTAASADDGAAAGTVRNGLPFAVDEVVVIIGSTRTRPLGRLESGQQLDWTIAGATDRNFDPSGSDTWQRFSGPRPDDTVNLALWQSSQPDIGLDQPSAGTAVAVGWTRQWRPTLTVGGRERSAPGRTAVVGRAPVTITGGHVTDLAVRSEVVRGPFPGPFGFDGGSTGEPTVVKFTLPDGAAAPQGLMLHSGINTPGLEVWQDGAWQALPSGAFSLKNVPGGPGVIVMPDGKRIIGGPAPPPFTPMTTMPPPLPPAVAPPTMPIAPPGPAGPSLAVPVPTTMVFGGPGPGGVVPAPMAVPGGGVQGGTFEVPIPAAAVNGGVVYLRLRIDMSSWSGDSTFTLGAAG
jgi:hypothetical protein